MFPGKHLTDFKHSVEGYLVVFFPIPNSGFFNIDLHLDGFWRSAMIQFNSIFYFSELYNSEKHIHVIQYLNNKLDIITKTSLDYTIKWDSKTALLVVIGLPPRTRQRGTR